LWPCVIIACTKERYIPHMGYLCRLATVLFAEETTRATPSEGYN
jgi:hypothetical protein